MRTVDVKLSVYIDFGIKNNQKDAKFKSKNKYQFNIKKQKKIFLLKVTFQISRKKFLWLKKVKNPVL